MLCVAGRVGVGEIDLGAVKSKNAGLEGRGRHDRGACERGPEPLVLAVEKEKRAVFNNWSANRVAKIITHIGILRVRLGIEVVPGAERVVASEPIRISV